MATINDLSDAILCEIFLHIDIVKRQHLELVCKRWQQIIRYIWSTRQKLIFRLEMDDFCPGIIEAETTIDWIRFTTPSISDVIGILKICEGNLTHLEIDDDAPSTEEAEELIVPIRNNKNLISFSIISDETKTIRSFIKYLPTEKLEELMICRTANSFEGTEMTDTIEEVLKGATTLKSLSLIFEVPPSILDVIAKMTTLQSLELGYMEPAEPPGRILFDTSALGNLENLNIRNDVLVDDDFLIELAKNCKKLHSIKFRSEESLTGNGLKALGTLESLRCVNMKVPNDIEVLAHFSNLEEFHCDLRGHEERISEEELSNFLERSPDLEKCNFNSEILDFLRYTIEMQE